MKTVECERKLTIGEEADGELLRSGVEPAPNAITPGEWLCTIACTSGRAL